VASLLFVLQYAHRRKPFILIWAAASLLMAPTMLFTGLPYTGGFFGRIAPGLSQLGRVATAALFVWSADVFRQSNSVQPRRLKFLVVLIVWFLLAPFVFSPRIVLVSGYGLAAVFFAVTGSMYAAALLERRLIGAGLVAFVFLGLAIANLSTAVITTRTSDVEPLLVETLLVNAVLYTLGVLGMHLLVFEDMTYELRITNRRLETVREELLQAAITDPLTGCQNRRFLDQVMDRELQRHSRFKLPLALLFIDINRFKAVNDTLGHEAGDRVLQYVARFLKRHIREADYVFRYGGDEFLVLITCTGEEARRKGAALKAAFDAAPEAAHLPPGIGLSVGWTEVPDGTTDLGPLVRVADERMYADKAGR